MGIDRRSLIRGGIALAGAATVPARAAFMQRPVARVIVDNDFSGDPDGLFQLAHHVLCGAVEMPIIVGSHLPAAFGSGHDASDARAKAKELLGVMGLGGAHDPLAGAETPISSTRSWRASGATSAIVREAMRSDASAPLLYCAGAGLTELALAWLAEPGIGRRIRLIWIGGAAHPGISGPSMQPGPEFNFSIDPVAAQIVFNDSDIEIWQVPADAYARMLFGTGELQRVGLQGRLGAYLKAAVDDVPAKFARIPGVPSLPRTDAYVLGDSPLVTLSALVAPFFPDPASSSFVARPTPRLGPQGTYEARPDGRPMRVYTAVDAGLTFRDMVARFETLADAERRGRPRPRSAD